MIDDKAGRILNASGLEVVEMTGERVPITRDNLVEKLERNRRETEIVIGKGAGRDATLLGRRGI